jgi:hypothetical protein
MYEIIMSVFMYGISPTGNKYPQRSRFTYKADTPMKIWQWVSRKRHELENDGYEIVSATYKITEG